MSAFFEVSYRNFLGIKTNFRVKAWFPLGDKGDNCDTIVAYRTNRIVGTFSYRPYRITIALIGLIALF